MNKIPEDILDKIFFNDFNKLVLRVKYNCNKSINNKINLYFYMKNIENINNELKKLIYEYSYEKNENIYSYWYSTHIPIYIYILYKNTSKQYSNSLSVYNKYNIS